SCRGRNGSPPENERSSPPEEAKAARSDPAPAEKTEAAAEHDQAINLPNPDNAPAKPTTNPAAAHSEPASATDPAPDTPHKFLQKLRPRGPWLLIEIVPDRTPTAITADTAEKVEAF